MDSIDTENLLGKSVTIVMTNDSSFLGEIAKVDGGRLVLKNVRIGGGGRKLLGPQFFQLDDIQTWTLDLDEDCGSKGLGTNKTTHRTTDNWKEKVLKRKIQQSHLSRLRNLDTDDLTTAKCVFAEEEDNIEGEEENYEDFYKVDDVTTICRICDKFREAIEYIMNQDVVGVTFRGVDNGRNGILSLIQVATETDVIIFDILRMGQEAFVEGLHEVFESTVTKIIHDSRWISDLLYHQFGVSLKNIFDTQVANAYVYSLCHGGDWPRFVDSLPACLMTHLDLASDQVFTDKVRERCQEEDQEIWLQRPLSENLVNLSVKNARYLIELKSALTEKMLLVFRVGVDIYLKMIKEAPQGNVDRYRANRHLLPCAFMDIQKYVDYEINNAEDFNYQRSERNWVRYNHKGFRENLVLQNDKDVIKSHDSIWHRSDEFYHEFRNRPKEACQAKNYDGSKGIPAEERFHRKQSGSPEVNFKDKSVKADLKNGSINKEHDRNSNNCNVEKNEMYLPERTLNVSEKILSKSKSVSPKMAHTSVSPSLPTDAKQPCEFHSLEMPIKCMLSRSKLFSKKTEINISCTGTDMSDAEQTSPKILLEKENVVEPNALEKELERLNTVGFISRKDFVSRNLSKDFNVAESSDSSSPPVKTVKSTLSDSGHKFSTSKLDPDPSLFGLGGSSSSETDLPSRNKNQNVLDNIVPAGLQPNKLSKKRQNLMNQRQSQFSGIEARELSRTKTRTESIDEDFGVIPHQSSLQRDLKYSLGVSAIGDPFTNNLDVDETPQSFIDAQLKMDNEGAIRDCDISDVEQTEVFQKVRQAAKSAVSNTLKSKLLPSKIKFPPSNNGR